MCLLSFYQLLPNYNMKDSTVPTREASPDSLTDKTVYFTIHVFVYFNTGLNTESPPIPNQSYSSLPCECVFHTVREHFHISGGVTGASYRAASKAAQPPSVMIKLCGLNKVLLTPLLWCNVSQRCKEQFTNM